MPATPVDAHAVEEDGSDAELIARSVADPSCFAALFDRHADEILRYVHARLGPDLAEDVTAETFLAAFRSRNRYDTARPDARPWRGIQHVLCTNPHASPLAELSP